MMKLTNDVRGEKYEILLDKKVYQDYQRLLDNPGTMDQYETITHTVKLKNGYEIDVKLCSGNEGYNWTEAVLFDEQGRQLAYSEPSDDFLGEWNFEVESKQYCVVVKIKE